MTCFEEALILLYELEKIHLQSDRYLAILSEEEFRDKLKRVDAMLNRLRQKQSRGS